MSIGFQAAFPPETCSAPISTVVNRYIPHCLTGIRGLWLWLGVYPIIRCGITEAGRPKKCCQLNEKLSKWKGCKWKKKLLWYPPPTPTALHPVPPYFFLNVEANWSLERRCWCWSFFFSSFLSLSPCSQQRRAAQPPTLQLAKHTESEPSRVERVSRDNLRCFPLTMIRSAPNSPRVARRRPLFSCLSGVLFPLPAAGWLRQVEKRLQLRRELCFCPSDRTSQSLACD